MTDGLTPRPEKLDIDEQPFLDATAEAKSKFGRFNLAIIGSSGVGKSSLVNAVFGRDWAKVGKGLPVTRGVSTSTMTRSGSGTSKASRSARRCHR
jgi:predicted GTPase